MPEENKTPQLDEQLDKAKGIVASLLDLSFKEFVTPKLIKVLYVLGLIGGILIALGILFGGINAGGIGMIGGLVAALVFLIVYLLATRVWCELVLVLFSIENNTRKK